MDLYYTIIFFIFGTILGSFYNVVGLRLSKGESIVKPKSHCTICNHELKVLGKKKEELILLTIDASEKINI